MLVEDRLSIKLNSVIFQNVQNSIVVSFNEKDEKIGLIIIVDW